MGWAYWRLSALRSASDIVLASKSFATGFTLGAVKALATSDPGQIDDDVVNSIEETGFGGWGVGLLGGVVLGLELCADAERDARVALQCFGPGERGTAGEGGR